MMAGTVKVPKRIIHQIDMQIKKQEARITIAQRHLQELLDARAQMEPLSGRDGRAKGGDARAEALSPDRRSEIAKSAAGARWHKSAQRR